MIKRLDELINNIDYVEIIQQQADIEIHQVSLDSRFVESNSLFVAIKGTHTDGHEYISKAIEKGAVVIICNKLPSEINKNVIYVRVEDPSFVLGIIASEFYGNPSHKMKVVGVTGTNGKTTTASLLYQLFTKLGYSCGLISTIDIKIGKESMPSSHTTPDAVSIQNVMHQMVEKECTYCFMEVSSHAVDQNRIAGIAFDGAIFTNITHDHLDYHLTFSNYLKAKKQFFDHLPKDAIALTNMDDKNGLVMLQNCQAMHRTYSLQAMSNYRCTIIDKFQEGMSLKLDGVEVYTKLSGTFNAYNLLSVYAMALELGMQKEDVYLAISTLNPIHGRFDTSISEVKKIVGIVDYAHTPDALEKVLIEAQKLKKSSKIITIIGCGGNRDKEKRPLMAKIACQNSDKVILTSDNPRFESPIDILNDMKEGLEKDLKVKSLTIVDRLEAIRTACVLAESQDIVVLAGKGHESYQEIEGIKHPFDDKKILLETWNEMNL
jgi:UDP-N-acetylmuramoyl-L-alanyl-D-glutamate--2,6-diaminopimelate ligase